MVHLAMHLPEEAILSGPVQYGWMYPVERRLGYLKSIVRNRVRPEGSIAEGYIVDECTTFCSRHFNVHLETKFNKESRFKDQNRRKQDDEVGIFSDGAKGSKNYKLSFFHNEFEKMVWYVLNNCDEAQPYIT